MGRKPPSPFLVSRLKCSFGSAATGPPTTPREYIETLAYDFLESTHSGWEDGEGANGEFRFSLSERTITLDYNERYVDYTHHEHEF